MEDHPISTFLRCGVIGYPVIHSRSPEIHLAFAAQAGIALDYVRIDATKEEFDGRVSAFFDTGGLGLNVTLPHKAAALLFADEADASAESAGAANVLTRLPGGQVRASNTDGTGFVRDLLVNLDFDLGGKRVLILGAGGAAAGIVPRLLVMGVDTAVIHNRTAERAAALVRRLADPRARRFFETDSNEPFDLVVNATSASLAEQEPALPPIRLAPGALAYDLVYADMRTSFMNRLQAFGARTADGWGMLVEQAAESFFLWHGIRPDTAPLLRRSPPAEAATSGALELI